MTTDTYLGANGVDSDECLTRYHLRGGALVSECWGRTSPADPAAAVAALEESAAISEEMSPHGGDYPGRAQACLATAARIREVANV